MVFTPPCPTFLSAIASSWYQPQEAVCLGSEQGLQGLFWASMLSCWAKSSKSQLTAWLQIRCCHTCPAGAVSRTTGIRKDHQGLWKRAIIFVPSVGGNSNRREPEPSCLNPHAFDNPAKQSSGELRAGVLNQISTVQNKTTTKCVF